MELAHPIFGPQTNEKLLEIILNEDEISWQQIIYDLVKSEQMDPWDIDISLLTQKFLEIIRALTELDFRIGGKIVLASAILLKIKGNQLMDEDVHVLDELFSQTEDHFDDFFTFDHEVLLDEEEEVSPPKIYPRTPQPRQRKLSVYDLVEALEQALDVQVKREKRALDRVESYSPEVIIPAKKMDVSALMNALLERITEKHCPVNGLSFSQLVPSEHKQDIVLTFIPLLHLTNERRVDLTQQESFSDIKVSLLDSTPVVYQEASESS